MADAESPQTPFVVVITHFLAEELVKMSYDNACNLIHYIANREPERLKNLLLFIDAMHCKGHTQCASTYNTGVPLLICCSVSLADARITCSVVPVAVANAHLHSAL